MVGDVATITGFTALIMVKLIEYLNTNFRLFEVNFRHQ
ncbi:hypothetical protein N752_17305 [Desulforamulus aquiferis]|nr:hypothetical protein N752_17305 [Desulforamulus aquiferis]